MRLLDRLRKNISMCTEEDYSDLARFFQDHRKVLFDYTVPNFSRWKWMFIANPNTQADARDPYIHHPRIWLFKKDNKILAHQASIPFLLKVGNEYRRSAWGVKVLVDPSYQNRGIGALLTEQWTADVDVPVALGVGNEAYKMYARSGWIDLGKMTCFVKPLDAGYIIQRRIPIPTVARVISGIVNLCLKLHDDIRSFRGNICSVEKVDRFDRAFDELWTRASAHYDVIAKRDSVYLNWRYASDSNPYYSILRVVYEDKVIGYAILTTGIEDGISTGHIIDFLAEHRHVKCVMAQIMQHFRSKKVQKVHLRILCKRLETVLRESGFHQRGEWAQMMVKQRDGVPSIVGDPGKWFVTLGDSDLDEEFLCENQRKLHRRRTA